MRPKTKRGGERDRSRERERERDMCSGGKRNGYPQSSHWTRTHTHKHTPIHTAGSHNYGTKKLHKFQFDFWSITLKRLQSLSPTTSHSHYPLLAISLSLSHSLSLLLTLCLSLSFCSFSFCGCFSSAFLFIFYFFSFAVFPLPVCHFVRRFSFAPTILIFFVCL